MYDVVYDLGAASTWTCFAKGPVKVRLTNAEQGWTWKFPGWGGVGVKKAKCIKSQEAGWVLGICLWGDPIVPLKRDLARAERRVIGESAVPGTALGGGWLGLKHSR